MTNNVVHIRIRNKVQMGLMIEHFAKNGTGGWNTPRRIVEKNLAEKFQYPTEIHVKKDQNVWDFGFFGKEPIEVMSFEAFVSGNGIKRNPPKSKKKSKKK